MNDPVDMVICWTPDAMKRGGTGQSILIAEAHNIPVFNMADNDSLNKLYRWVES